MTLGHYLFATKIVQASPFVAKYIRLFLYTMFCGIVLLRFVLWRFLVRSKDSKQNDVAHTDWIERPDLTCNRCGNTVYQHPFDENDFACDTCRITTREGLVCLALRG